MKPNFDAFLVRERPTLTGGDDRIENEASPRAQRAQRAGGSHSLEADGRERKEGAVRVLCLGNQAVLARGLKTGFAIDGRLVIVGALSSASQLAEEVERLHPDVLMLDIELPGLDAFEVAQRWRQADPNMRVVVLSAHVRAAYVSASLRAGVGAYFSKSDELEDIIRGIHQVARERHASFLLGPKVGERCRAETVKRMEPTPHNTEPKSRSASPAILLHSLTPREAELLCLIGNGLSRMQIAAQLRRSAKTIDAHQGRMLKKLGIQTRSELMRFAIREGLASA